MKIPLLFKNFASMTSLRLGSAAFTFTLFWLLSHRLSTSQLGGYSLLMNVFFMVQALPLLGMTMPLMRRIAAHPDQMASQTSNSLYFALPVAAIIGLGLAATGHWYVNEGLGWPFVLLGFSMLPNAWIVVAESILIGHERTYSVAIVNILESLGRLLGAWVAVELGWGLIGVFSVFVCLRLAAGAAYFLNRTLPRPQWRLIRSSILQAYRRDVPTFLSIFVVTGLCTRIDILLLSELLTLHDVGIYAAAARLSDAALMVPTMAAVVIFPSQARLFESDRAAFARVLATALRWCLVGGFSVAILVIAVSPAVIRGIYSPQLAAAAPILQILILGTAMMVIDQLLSTTMMAAHAQRDDLQSMILGLVILTALLCVGTHFLGLLGAAIAMPTALLVRVLYRVYWAQRVFKTPILSVVARVLVAAGIGVAVGSVANVGLALLAYGIALWATRSIRVTDWQAVRLFVGQRRGLQS